MQEGNLAGYAGPSRHNRREPRYPEVHEDSQFENPRVKVDIGAVNWRAIGTVEKPHERPKSEEADKVATHAQAWTKMQEKTLLKLRSEGYTWGEIATKMGGTRSPVALKVHWRRHLRGDVEASSETEPIPETEEAPLVPEPALAAPDLSPLEVLTEELSEMVGPEATMAGTVMQSSDEAAQDVHQEAPIAGTFGTVVHAGVVVTYTTEPRPEPIADKPSRLRAMGENIGDLCARKNLSYGDAVAQSGAFLQLLYPDGIGPEQYSDALLLVRTFDKQMRIATAKDSLGESPWADLAGYGILGAVADDERRRA